MNNGNKDASDSIDVSVGERIAKARNLRGFSQRELADAIHVSKSTIKHYEHGRAVPSTRRLNRIALVLRCKATDLTGEDDDGDDEYLRASPATAFVGLQLR